MSTVLLTSVGGLPQVSVIKHLRTLPEVTRIIGHDAAGYWGASRALLDGYGDDPNPPHNVILPCGDRDAVKLNPALADIVDKPALMRRLEHAGIPVPRWFPPAWEKPTTGSGGRDGRQRPMWMEYLPGRDWSVDVLWAPPCTVAAVARERVRAKGYSLHGRVRHPSEAHKWAVIIANALAIPGIINIQLRENAEGVPLCYEVNPRISGSIMLSVYAGVDLLRMEIRRQLGLDYSDLNTTPRDGATMHRYFSEVFDG